MCTPSRNAMMPYGIKLPSSYFPFGPTAGLAQAHLSALDFQRSQINDYNVRVQLGLRNYQNSMGFSPFHAYITDPYAQAYFYKHDPRARFVQEEPKPSHSYIGLIGMAILNSKEKKLVLSDIYQWILDNYSYFRTRGPGWRNSIRHNLSLNDCFIKSGRSANGKGHYWAIHPANVEDFQRGDFRRRRAQRKVRRHMGLSVPDDDDSPSPSPTHHWTQDTGSSTPCQNSNLGCSDEAPQSTPPGMKSCDDSSKDPQCLSIPQVTPVYTPFSRPVKKSSKKRLFDMASLLAPDDTDEDEELVNDCVNGCPKSEQSQLDRPGGLSGFVFRPIAENGGGPVDKLGDRNCTSSDNNERCKMNDDYSTCTPGCDTKDMHSHDSDYGVDDDENCEIQVTSGENSPVPPEMMNFDASDNEDDHREVNSVDGAEISEGNIVTSKSGNNKKSCLGKRRYEQSLHSVPDSNNDQGRSDSAIDLSSSTTTTSVLEQKENEKEMIDTRSHDDDRESNSHSPSGHSDRSPNVDHVSKSPINEIKSSSNNASPYNNSLLEHPFQEHFKRGAKQFFDGSYAGHKIPLSPGSQLSPEHFDIYRSKDFLNMYASHPGLRFLKPEYEAALRHQFGVRPPVDSLSGHPSFSPEGNTSTTSSMSTSASSPPASGSSPAIFSESLRRSDESIRWSNNEIARAMLPRERMSAFSSLTPTRGQAQVQMFPRFQTALPRGFPLQLPGPPRLTTVPTGLTLRPAGPVPPVSSTMSSTSPPAQQLFASTTASVIKANDTVGGKQSQLHDTHPQQQQQPPCTTAGMVA